MNLYHHFREWFAKGGDNTKLRDDHRHHALDAIIIAITSPRELNILAQRFNDLRNKNIPYEDIVGTIKLDSPWPSFYKDVRERLSQIIVSQRVDSKVTGVLSDQNQLGKIRGEDNKFVKKVAITDMTFKQFCSIRDNTIQSIIWEHLRKDNSSLPEEFHQDTKIDKKEWERVKKKAFIKDDWPHTKNKDGDEHYPIKKVRIIVKQEPHLVLKAKTPRSVYLKGDNHHIALYQKPDGKIEPLAVSKAEVLNRIQTGKSSINQTHPDHPDWLLIFSICKRDILQQIDNKTGEKSFYYVTALGEKQVKIRSQYDSGKGKLYQLHYSSLLEKGFSKVSVDPIGQVRKAK